MMAPRQRRSRIERQIRSRYFFLPLGVFAVLGLIFPGVTLLAKWTGTAAKGDLAWCSALPLEWAGAALLLFAGISVAWTLALRTFDSALYAMAWAVPTGATLALWFYLAGLGVVVCRPLPFRAQLLFAVNSVCLLALALAFRFYLRPRLPRVVESNPQKWDFTAMKYSLLAPVFPLESAGRVTAGKVLAVIVAFVGAKLALDRLFAGHMSPSEAGDWEGAMLEMLLGYVFLTAALGQAYIAWIVRERCAALGAKMTIREFSA